MSTIAPPKSFYSINGCGTMLLDYRALPDGSDFPVNPEQGWIDRSGGGNANRGDRHVWWFIDTIIIGVPDSASFSYAPCKFFLRSLRDFPMPSGQCRAVAPESCVRVQANRASPPGCVSYIHPKPYGFGWM